MGGQRCKAERWNDRAFFPAGKKRRSFCEGFDHNINKSPRITKYMKLTEKEKKILTILHEARLIDRKLLKGYENKVKKYFSFSDEELHKTIIKFLKSGLLEEIKLKDNEVMYMHTNKVSQEMIDSKLSEVGH